MRHVTWLGFQEDCEGDCVGTWAWSGVGACGEVEAYVVHEDEGVGEAFLGHNPSRTQESMLACIPADTMN